MSNNTTAQFPTDAPKKRRKWPLVIAALAGVGIIAAIAAPSDEPDAIATPSVPTNEAPVALPEPAPSADPLTTSGTWLVGEEIQPGSYKVIPNGPSGMGYIARCSAAACSMQGNGGGVLGDILENKAVQGPAYIDILPTDVAVQTSFVTLEPVG